MVNTGNNLDQLTVSVARMFNKQFQVLASGTGTLAAGTSYVLKGTGLPLPLKITRTSCRYEFNYGDPQKDGLRWYGFHSENAGYEPHPIDPSLSNKPQGQYCYTADLPKNDPRGPGKSVDCNFPGY